eukprot:403334583
MTVMEYQQMMMKQQQQQQHPIFQQPHPHHQLQYQHQHPQQQQYSIPPVQYQQQPPQLQQLAKPQTQQQPSISFQLAQPPTQTKQPITTQSPILQPQQQLLTQQQLQIQQLQQQHANLSIGMLISLHKMQNKGTNASSKDHSKAFYPYSSLDLIQQAKNIEKIQQSRATSDQLDEVDECIDFFNHFAKLNPDDIRDTIAQKYANPDKRISLSKSQQQKLSAGGNNSAGQSKLKFLNEQYDMNRAPSAVESGGSAGGFGGSNFKQKMMNEMGLSEEGANAYSARGTERRGLGIQQQMQSSGGGGGSDQFDSFRTQRSKRYHVAAEERQRGIKEEQLCYICQQPGHIAKDCKFGIN